RLGRIQAFVTDWQAFILSVVVDLDYEPLEVRPRTRPRRFPHGLHYRVEQLFIRCFPRLVPADFTAHRAGSPPAARGQRGTLQQFANTIWSEDFQLKLVQLQDVLQLCRFIHPVASEANGCVRPERADQPFERVRLQVETVLNRICMHWAGQLYAAYGCGKGQT